VIDLEEISLRLTDHGAEVEVVQKVEIFLGGDAGIAYVYRFHDDAVTQPEDKCKEQDEKAA
jgi:hypothetical protein